MKRLLFGCGLCLLLLCFSDVALAQRHRSDRHRLRRAVRTGQLTPNQAQLIRERLRQIREDRYARRTTGGLSRAERRQAGFNRRLRRNNDDRSWYDKNRGNHRRGNGYYRRGAGSVRHPVFGRRNRSN